MSEILSSAVKTIVDSDDVVVFIKGIPSQPQCSQSATLVSALHRLNAPFKPVNLLSNPALRDAGGAPQLFVKGESIGDSATVKALYDSGALSQLLNEKGIAHRPV